MLHRTILASTCLLLRRARGMSLSPGTTPSLDSLLASRIDYSYVRELRVDPDAVSNAPNRLPREVESGHFVRVAPTPMRAPYLVAVSRECAQELGLDADECATSDKFIRIFSGDISAGAPGLEPRGWATPYALSIYGSEVVPNGAGPRGYGYGDGRAISIAEVLLPGEEGGRMELQLKGGGRTPFCRGADGSAVLRSSVREFLASEAMAALGVPTTRALSLIASAEETIARPWYSNSSSSPSGASDKHGGDVMVPNRRAITTRVARSFLRVGQFELYGRRAARGEVEGKEELELLARHALKREYSAVLRDHPSVAAQGGDGEGVTLSEMSVTALSVKELRAGIEAAGIDHRSCVEKDELVALLMRARAGVASSAALQPAILAMLREASRRFAHLASSWLRVGFVQSNYNADNSLVGGATMDYGPFGFVERYDPNFAMWIGAGQHFSFINQPNAAGKNFGMFVKSLAHLLDEEGVEEARRILGAHGALSAATAGGMWARKMGFREGVPLTDTTPVWKSLELLMASHPTDYTILYRQLPHALKAAVGATSDDAGVLLAHLAPAFYSPLPANMTSSWHTWLTRWKESLIASGTPLVDAIARMLAANPKFIPREWMLVEAYTAAEGGDHALVLELHELFKRPYDEHDDAMTAKWYRRAPAGVEGRGGVGFMS